MSTGLLILCAGLLTFGTRLSFILLLERIRVPDWFRRGLRFVPVAVLSAITLPELVNLGGKLALTWHNAQLPAGIVAVLVAWRTKNVFLTILVGMAALYLFKGILGLF
jgi:branched-subunit amino acid transport protein